MNGKTWMKIRRNNISKITTCKNLPLKQELSLHKIGSNTDNYVKSMKNKLMIKKSKYQEKKKLRKAFQIFKK